MKRKYELTLVLEPELDKEGKEKLLDKIKKLFEKAKVSEEKDWGVKDLAYPIKKQKRGIFYWLKFEAEPEILPDLNKKLKLEEKILRYLLVCEGGK